MVEMRVAIGEHPREQSSTESAVGASVLGFASLSVISLRLGARRSRPVFDPLRGESSQSQERSRSTTGF